MHVKLGSWWIRREIEVLEFGNPGQNILDFVLPKIGQE